MGSGREVQEGGAICIPVADSCWCMAENNTTLSSIYPPIKKKKKKKLKQNNVSNGLMRNVLSWRIWCNTCLFIFDFFKSSEKYQFHIKYHCFIGALLGGSVQRLNLVLKWRWVHLGPAMVRSCCPLVSLQVLKSLWQAERWARLAPRIQKCKFQKPRAKSRKMEYILKWTPHPEGNFDPPKYYKNTKEDLTE